MQPPLRQPRQGQEGAKTGALPAPARRARKADSADCFRPLSLQVSRIHAGSSQFVRIAGRLKRRGAAAIAFRHSHFFSGSQSSFLLRAPRAMCALADVAV
jgi:hypothetical protein